MDFSLILNSINLDVYEMVMMGIFVLIVIFSSISRFSNYQKKKFIPENFDNNKSAIILEAHHNLLYIRIRKVTMNSEDPTTYTIYSYREPQVIMAEPGLYYIDELSYRKTRHRRDYSEEVTDTFDQENWLTPDDKFRVPTGAFYAEAGKVLYLGGIWIFLRKRLVWKLSERLSFRVSWKYNIKNFTSMLPRTKRDENTTLERFNKLSLLLGSIRPFFLDSHQPYVTKHQRESLFDIKAWFHKKYPQVPVVPQKGEYYMPGSTIDLETLPGFKETIT
tara:strand:+ start:205 stop:1032 length:828 start_codon:yes stop_codon:yes gene_type:complete